MNWDNLPLLIILVLSVIGNNHSVLIAASVLLFIKLLGFNTWFPQIEKYGITLGIIILTLAVLAPLAQNRISVADIAGVFKSPAGIIAVVVGIFVAWVAAQGVPYMNSSPEVVTALIVGTIIGVCFFKGLAVGPLIAGGLVYLIVSLLNLAKN
ncbi:MAG: rane protein yeaL [Firmicutes bacterium]|nr:rane protein yeaL [Bacillota bacterium]